MTLLPFGLTEGMAVRISMLSAAVWWAGSTFIPFLGLRNRPPTHVVPESGGYVSRSFGQLWSTLKGLRRYPVALTFLVAYLFFNDGIQTVIASASIYGVEERWSSPPAPCWRPTWWCSSWRCSARWALGRAAERFGAKSVILAGLVIWMLIVTAALFVPEKALVAFLALAVAIGIVRAAPRRSPGPTSAS